MTQSIENIDTIVNAEGWMTQTPPAVRQALEAISMPNTSFIDGEYKAFKETSSVQRHTPITGQIIGTLSYADQQELDHAVDSCRLAFDDGRWSKADASERGRILINLGNLIAMNADTLSLVESLDTGKPFCAAKAIDVDEAALTFRWYGELCNKLGGELAPKGPFELLIREPLGVCACISPFNYPLMITAWKIAPMLAAGNTVVLKPSEKTPGTALLLARLAVEAGLPPGVLNVVIGDGPTAGAFLASHPHSDAIGFTGSSEVGLAVAQSAYQNRIKAVYMECGGKSPALVLPDADIDAAIDAICGGVFYMAGQSCNAPTRAIVHQDVASQFIEGVAGRLETFRPNNPLNPDTEVGALISAAKFTAVKNMIEADVSNGGRVLAGELRNLSTRDGAAYVTPICIQPSDNGAAVVQKELFAPVLCVQTFHHLDDAIAMANSTKYGLWASAWTNDLPAARRLCLELSSGTVAINDQFAGDISTPMGGTRSAGLGKDRGRVALEKYQVIKHASLG